ncbi:ABC transporter permease [Arthrobacter sp. GMC3]|uniref:ABC transporter permease n=1 Tax=Arthrobacter sp. GMC3 TaxID=2058894 RepID=UPI000CE3A45E|nr:FtsX-like permease family protein [Arthrobacter sp. GMC3]
MLQVAFSQLKTHSRRFIAITLAVLLAVAFLSATLMVNASTKASLVASMGESYAGADLVISPPGETPLTGGDVKKVAASPDVAGFYAQRSLYVAAETGTATLQGTLRNMPTVASLEPFKLLSGSWPSSDAQVTVDQATADHQKLSVGQSVSFKTNGSSGSLPGPTLTTTISGITASATDPLASGQAQFVGTDAASAALASPDSGFGLISLTLKDGVSLDAARSSLAASLGQPAGTILTPEEKTTAQVSMLTGGQDQLTIVLLAFAAVALLVSALVVSNTFSVLVAQRTRELALLRCVGASRSQVRNSVIVEALVVGFIASVLGVLSATGIMAAILAILRSNPDFAYATLAVPPSAIIAGILVGTLLTVLAALVPARAATAVAPLAALRPADDASLHNTGGRVRLAIGVVLILAGGAGLVYGGLSASLFVALPAGAASFVGFLMAASLFIPKLVSLAGKLASPAGVPGKMAAANAVRNPRRTTATASALLIGVTLVTMMMTGAATARNAFDTQLDGHYPVDITAQKMGDNSPFTPQQVATTAALPGVKKTVLLKPVGTATVGGQIIPVYGISDADAGALLVNPANRPAGNAVVLPRGIKATSVELAAGSQTTTVAATAATTDSFDALVSLSTFTPLASDETASIAPQVWIAVDPGLSTQTMMDLRSNIATSLGVSEFMVSGAVLEKAMFSQVIDMMLLIVTGLLAVAVFIALIGVANTLSLSVLERTRENSLLRALGLTRGQLRGMLALEAVLIAGVAALIGSVLGVVYGWLGAQSALGGFTAVTATIPWGQILMVVGVAAVAGLLASVIPARRAARLSPVEGLAMD